MCTRHSLPLRVCKPVLFAATCLPNYVFTYLLRVAYFYIDLDEPIANTPTRPSICPFYVDGLVRKRISLSER
jgi:hypothetical protein